MSRPTREELKADGRPNRVPVHEANRNKLTVRGLDPNYEHRWIRQDDERVQTFLDGGWEFVHNRKQQVGDGGVDQSTGTSSIVQKGGGGGVVLLLMRIPKEFYQADQAKKEKAIAELEADMKVSAERDFRGNLRVSSGKTHGPFGDANR